MIRFVIRHMTASGFGYMMEDGNTIRHEVLDCKKFHTITEAMDFVSKHEIDRAEIKYQEIDFGITVIKTY